MSVYRLLKRHNLSLRKAYHIGQKLPINAKNEYYDFLYQNCKNQKIILYRRKFDLIVNCDETSLYYEMIENKTIDFIDEKNIIIKTNGGEKKRITSLLANTGSGKKLKPLLIFKGVKDDLIEKKFETIPVIHNKYIQVISLKNHGVILKFIKNG